MELKELKEIIDSLPSVTIKTFEDLIYKIPDFYELVADKVSNKIEEAREEDNNPEEIIEDAEVAAKEAEIAAAEALKQEEIDDLKSRLIELEK